MRLCIVSMTGIYPVDIGGPGSVGYFLAKELGKLDYEIDLYVRVKDEKHQEDIDSCRELQELKNVQIVPTRVRYSLSSYINFPYLLNKIRQISSTFSTNEYDIVHYNSPPVDVTYRLPTIAHSKDMGQTLAVHGGLFYESKNFIGKYMIKRKRTLFQKIIVLNRFSKKLAVDAGFKEDKITVIPNGVDLETIQEITPLELQGDPKILFTGRLAEVKGIEILLQSFSELTKSFPNARLYIIGDGPLRDNLENLSSTLRIEDKVSFEGFIPRTTDVYRYYKSVDLFVLPSYKENFSISLLEAMGFNVPIIASDADGNKEFIHDGENGLIFPRGNPVELRERMELLLSDQTLAHGLTSNANDLILEKYNWTKIASTYDTMFKSLTTSIDLE